MGLEAFFSLFFQTFTHCLLYSNNPDLRWLDIMESSESLTVGSPQLLQGTPTYIVGDSTEINQKGAQKLATDLGYLESICGFNYQYELLPNNI